MRVDSPSPRWEKGLGMRDSGLWDWRHIPKYFLILKRGCLALELVDIAFSFSNPNPSPQPLSQRGEGLRYEG